MRFALLGLVGFFTATATARPPEPPEGRELSPVVREFHEPDVAQPTGLPVLPAQAVPRPAPEMPVSVDGLLCEVRKSLLERLTMPLGTVPVED